MGVLEVKGYSLYKAAKNLDYADVRIPVGMPASLWQAKLKQQAIDAKFSHAMWAAKRIARWVETRRRMGAGFDEALQLIEADPSLQSRLGLFAVHAILRPLAMRVARELVESGKLKPRREQVNALD